MNNNIYYNNLKSKNNSHNPLQDELDYCNTLNIEKLENYYIKVIKPEYKLSCLETCPVCKLELKDMVIIHEGLKRKSKFHITCYANKLRKQKIFISLSMFNNLTELSEIQIEQIYNLFDVVNDERINPDHQVKSAVENNKNIEIDAKTEILRLKHSKTNYYQVNITRKSDFVINVNLKINKENVKSTFEYETKEMANQSVGYLKALYLKIGFELVK